MKAFSLRAAKPLVIFLSFALVSTTYGQNSKDDKDAAKKELIKNMVAAQNYAFKAQTAQPMSGGNRQLTSDYDVKITKEKIISFLPYFGRAYSAPINSTQGGIQFSSSSFEYSLTDRKKGGWDVLIKPKDAPEVQQLTMTISENGYATLQATNTNRQPISFTGYIVEIKAK